MWQIRGNSLRLWQEDDMIAVNRKGGYIYVAIGIFSR